MRMRYDLYLAWGYPIASGVIEGAAVHYVKDRMERAEMHWTKAGTQAVLDVQSEYLNGEWKAFQRFRIDRERDCTLTCCYSILWSGQRQHSE